LTGSDKPVIAPRNILLITPAPGDHSDLALALRAAGYRVEVVGRVQESASPDLAVVDIRGGDLWPMAEFLSGRRLVVLVDGPAAMRRAFDLGAEDCVLAGAHPDEVVARCDAVLRRTADRPARTIDEPTIYVDGRLWVNFDSRQVWVGERPAHLTPREFRLLGFLIRRRDQTLGHEAILESVWSRPPAGDRPAEVLKQYIWRLRQKIEVDPNAPEVILTDPGEGYRFASHSTG
jgi:two-component system, OmpR family, KDP operon response regulator KdpE